MGGHAVRARGPTKSFGDVVALDGVDLDLAAGQVHGLVGPNGAGRSTLLGLLLGLAVADRGTVEILGVRVRARHAVPEGVAGVLDSPGLYPWLTARQNLAWLAALRGSCCAEVDDALGEVGLADVAGDTVRGFSLGMRQRLGLAAALLTRPHIPGSSVTGTAAYQLDVNANGRYVADGDGPQEVDGSFRIRTLHGDVSNPLWQIDGVVDLLPPSRKE